MNTMMLAAVLFFAVISPSYALSAVTIGHVHTLKGKAVISRGTQPDLPVSIGAAVNQGDLIRTLKGSAVGIVFTDDTVITLGPNSELVVKDYDFTPKQGKFSLLVRMVKGTFVYLSGLIGKLAPDSIRLETPDAFIGIRGTKILVEVKE